MEMVRVHHIAIICSDYQRSKNFYTTVLNCRIVRETYRPERQSWKLDLELPSGEGIELFSFPSPPVRLSGPEARGLRHLAFEVRDVQEAVEHLQRHGVSCEDIRVDELTNKKFTFFRDPDDLPLELYEG